MLGPNAFPVPVTLRAIKTALGEPTTHPLTGEAPSRDGSEIAQEGWLKLDEVSGLAARSVSPQACPCSQALWHWAPKAFSLFSLLPARGPGSPYVLGLLSSAWLPYHPAPSEEGSRRKGAGELSTDGLRGVGRA